MRKQIAVLLLLVGMASWCYAQKIPKEVQDIIKNYTRDSTMHFGFNQAKNFFPLEKSLQFSDIKVGAPIEVYGFQYDLLEKSDDTASIKSLICPSNFWYLPIVVRGRYIYEVEIVLVDGTWITCGMGAGIAKLLQNISDTRPFSLNSSPIIIRDATRFYLHFPQKGSHNLLYLNPFIEDSLGMITSNLNDTLNDSRIILKYRKNEYKKQKPKRDEFFKNNPNIFRNNSNSGGYK